MIWSAEKQVKSTLLRGRQFRIRCPGSIILRHGLDNRTIIYTYEGSANGVDHFTKATVSKSRNITAVESGREFFYYLRGQPISTILSLILGEKLSMYETSYNYDLHGQDK